MVNEHIKTKLRITVRITSDNKASIEAHVESFTPDIYETLMALYELIANKYEIPIKSND